MRTRTIAMSSIMALVLSCGGSDSDSGGLAEGGGVYLSIRSELKSTADSIEVLFFGKLFDCGNFREQLRKAGSGEVTLAGTFMQSPPCDPSDPNNLPDDLALCTIARTALHSTDENGQGGKGSVLTVSVGTRSVVAIAIDDQDRIVAADCAGPLVIREVAMTEAVLVLE